MAELLDILDAFAMPLKVGWVVWLAWGIGLVFWYRHDRRSEIALKRPSPPVRKPFRVEAVDASAHGAADRATRPRARIRGARRSRPGD
jgi:hypothetical protein